MKRGNRIVGSILTLLIVFSLIFICIPSTVNASTNDWLCPWSTTIQCRVSQTDAGHNSSSYYAIDFASGGVNIDLYAPTSGIIRTNSFDSDGYGNYIQINTDDGYIVTMAHFQSPSSLLVGQRVAAGQPVGKMGTTGNSTGIHLHFDVRNSAGKVYPSTLFGKNISEYTLNSYHYGQVNPAGLCPTLNNPSDGIIIQAGTSTNFSWTNIGASRYKIRFINDSGAGTTDINVSGTNITFTPNSAGNWRWKVCAFPDSGIEGTYSSERHFTVPGSPSPTPTPTPPPPPTGNFTIQYFNSEFLQGSVIYTQSANDINKTWGSGSPGGGVNSDSFSARFTGTVNFEQGYYNFHYDADDGVKVIIDDTNCIIDNSGPGAVGNQGCQLSSGNHKIVVEYTERTGDARVLVNWSKTTPPTPANFVVQNGELITYNGSECVVNIPDNLGISRIGTSAFNGKTNITSVTIPDGVTSIADSAFSACTGLISVNIPHGITSIGLATFKNCTNLTTINIPDGVTTIGVQAFLWCTSLKTIVFPSSIISMAQLAFGGCSNLSSAYFLGDAPNITDMGVFNAAKSDFVVYYYNNKAGFTSPTWNGYPSSAIVVAKPDLCPTAISYDSGIVQVGNTVYFDTGVSNTGNANSSGFNVRWLVNNIDVSAAGYHEGISANTTVMNGNSGFYWTPLAEGTYQIRFIIDWDNQIIEYNENNNETSTIISVATAIPDAPLNLKVVSRGYNSNTVTWTAIPGAAGYVVYRSTASDSGFTQIATPTTASYTSTGLTTGTMYYYKIKSYVTVDTVKIYSAETAPVGAKPVPNIPTNQKVVSAGYNSNKITWTAISGATGYVVYRSTTAASGFVQIATVTTPSYTSTGLTTGKMYYYKIKAYTTVGTTKIYSAATAAVGAKPIPATPTALTAARVSSTSIKVSWKAVPGATGYVVYRSLASSSGFVQIATNTTAVTYTNVGLITGKTYYYKVKAYRTVGTTKIYSIASGAVGAKT